MMLLQVRRLLLLRPRRVHAADADASMLLPHCCVLRLLLRRQLVRPRPRPLVLRPAAAATAAILLPKQRRRRPDDAAPPHAQPSRRRDCHSAAPFSFRRCSNRDGDGVSAK